MNYLSILILLLLSGAAAGGVLVTYRPRLAPGILLVAGTGLLFLWLPARLQLPAQTVVEQAGIGALPPWRLQLNAGAWWLGLSLILLLLAGGLTVWAGEQEPAGQTLPTFLLPLLIAGAALAAATADSLPTLLVTWLLLDLLWYLALVAAAPDGAGAPGRFFPVVALFLLWLAALTVPEATGVSGLEIGGWPVLTKSLLLLAALIQIGAFPFHLWRPFATRFSPLQLVLAHTAPPVAGAALLVRLEAATDISLAFALPLTLAGLLGLLWSANLSWRHGNERLPVAAALGLGQTGLVLLAATWAGPDAILAEARVLLLGSGILLLATARAETALPWRLAPIVALVAFAGLPFTVGFGGRAALYDAWLDSGRWLLVLVTALLHVPFLGAALLLWGKRSLAVPRPQSARAMALLAALLLPAAGLLSLAGLTTASIGAWLAVLLPAGGALLLTRFLEESEGVQQMVEEALSLPFSPRPFYDFVQEGGQALLLALAEALAILEGKRGLLWLFFILLLIWLVG